MNNRIFFNSADSIHNPVLIGNCFLVLACIHFWHTGGSWNYRKLLMWATSLAVEDQYSKLKKNNEKIMKILKK